ncbi:MAG: hypothetical protein RLZZ179_3229 [Verrucomicrobiota bacterium]
MTGVGSSGGRRWPPWSLLKNRARQRDEGCFHKARRGKGEDRDLRLRRNEAFWKKAHRPQGSLQPATAQSLFQPLKNQDSLPGPVLQLVP